MSADSGATRYFGSKEATAREKDAPPRPAESYASSTVGRTEKDNQRIARSAAKKKRKAVAKQTRDALRAIDKKLGKVVKQAVHDEQEQLIDYIAVQGLRTAAGLFQESGSDGYNPDAPMPLADASTKTQFGMKVYAQMMAKQRENQATARALGVVMLQSQLNEKDWNARAKEVDEEQRKLQAIAVADEMLKASDE